MVLKPCPWHYSHCSAPRIIKIKALGSLPALMTTEALQLHPATYSLSISASLGTLHSDIPWQWCHLDWIRGRAVSASCHYLISALVLPPPNVASSPTPWPAIPAPQHKDPAVPAPLHSSWSAKFRKPLEKFWASLTPHPPPKHHQNEVWNLENGRCSLRKKSWGSQLLSCKGSRHKCFVSIRRKMAGVSWKQLGL